MKYFLAVMILALLPVTGIVVYAHMLMHKRPFLKYDVYTENFPEEIVMKNERFGPWPDPEKVTRIRP